MKSISIHTVVAVTQIILEKSVKCEKDMQRIDVHGEAENFGITLLEVRDFSAWSGASRGRADIRD